MATELNESQTRALLINPQLVAANWKLNDRSLVRFEIPVDGYDAEPWNGVTDYCLYDHAGNVLAVVEAKRASRSPREADEQLRHYITEIAKRDLSDMPRELAAAGDFPSKSDSQGVVRPLDTWYQARVKFDHDPPYLLAGIHGRAQISVAPSPLLARAARWLKQTFSQ